jgi:tetratricopeptide (TPR) repeat protein
MKHIICPACGHVINVAGESRRIAYYLCQKCGAKVAHKKLTLFEKLFRSATAQVKDTIPTDEAEDVHATKFEIRHSCGNTVRIVFHPLSPGPICPSCRKSITLDSNLEKLIARFHSDRDFAAFTAKRHGSNLEAWLPRLSKDEITIAAGAAKCFASLPSNQARSGLAEIDASFQQIESKLRVGEIAPAISLLRQAVKQSASEDTGRGIRSRAHNLALALTNEAEKLNKEADGNKYFSAGLAELDAATAIWEVLLEYEPNAPDIWCSLGLAYDQRGRCEKAEPCYRRAIELDPKGVNAADAWMNVGVLHMAYAKTVMGKDRTGNSVKIPLAGLRKEQFFPTRDSFIAIDPNSDSPHWKSAEAAFEQAVSIYSNLASQDRKLQLDLARAHWNLAELYTDLLQGSKATHHVLACYRLEPHNQKAINWLRQAERNTGKKLL